MRVPLSWLREYVAVDLPPEQLAHRLTTAGAEVGAIERVGAEWRRVVIGRIDDLARHPRKADLWVAAVDLADMRATLVTAATNLQVGDRVPVVLAGGTLPTGPVDRRAFDGVVSDGMLCSGAELGIAEDRGGIYVLEPDAPVGAELAAYLGDVVLDIEVTPNRPDLLSVVGVAREVAALTGATLRPPEAQPPRGSTPVEQAIAVRIEAPDLCPRYSATVLEGVRIGPSPLWLQRRLHLCGMRPISNVVDVTNYVMLELGQPLHAFDGATLRGGIVVRRARAGERIITIDGVERPLSPDMLVIADEAVPVAVAGVMGGFDTEVNATTTRIVLESAHFEPRAVRRTGRALRLASEALRRFERGVDPQGTTRAADRATALIVDLAGGQAAAGHVDVYPNPERPREIWVTPAAINGLLGESYTRDLIASTLRGLGFQVSDGPASGATDARDARGAGQATDEDGLTVVVPTFRRDVVGPADLAEEVARIRGYDTIPTRLPAGQLPPVETDPRRRLVATAKSVLVAAGYQEVITYSLVDGFQAQRLDSSVSWPPARTTPEAAQEAAAAAGLIPIYNVMSADHAYLRSTLLGSLLATLAVNLRHRERVYLFEFARVYAPPLAPLPTESARLGLVFCGPREPATWHAPPAPGDFYDLKGAVEAVARAFWITGLRYEPGRHPTLHPGRSAVVLQGETTLGVFGQVHPAVAERFDLEGRAVYAAELDFDALVQGAGEQPAYTPLPRHPGVAMDLAVVVDEAVPEAEVAAAIRAAGSPLLAEFRLFDVYRGAPVPAGRKSLAYALVYRAPDRTLADEDTAEVQAAIETLLRDRFGGQIRGR